MHPATGEGAARPGEEGEEKVSYLDIVSYCIMQTCSYFICVLVSKKTSAPIREWKFNFSHFAGNNDKKTVRQTGSLYMY